jgi:hypothetical protein
MPLQRVSPFRQAHTPFWQLVPPAQRIPQPPQLLSSLCVFTQALPQMD